MALNQIGGNTTASHPFVTADSIVYFRGTNDNNLWKVNGDRTGQTQIGTNTTKSAPFVFTDPITGGGSISRGLIISCGRSGGTVQEAI